MTIITAILLIIFAYVGYQNYKGLRRELRIGGDGILGGLLFYGICLACSGVMVLVSLILFLKGVL